MHRHLAVLVGTVVLVGCIDAPPSASPSPGEPWGSLAAELTLGASRHDLTAVRYEIVPANASCGDPPLYTQTSRLEEEALPASLDDGAIAKLRGEPGICGAPMPRGRPALPEEEIVLIEDWISGLPFYPTTAP